MRNRSDFCVDCLQNLIASCIYFSIAAARKPEPRQKAENNSRQLSKNHLEGCIWCMHFSSPVFVVFGLRNIHHQITSSSSAVMTPYGNYIHVLSHRAAIQILGTMQCYSYTYRLGQLTHLCIPGFPCDPHHISQKEQSSQSSSAHLRTKHSAATCFYSSQANAGGESQIWAA